jgi:hypothetical protein
MSDQPESGEKKIIVDEDWKSQVEREKEELASAGDSAGDSAEGESKVAHTAAGGAPADAGPEPELPPASLAFLVSTMAAQAMAAMGQLPDPISGKPEIRLKFAKHHIDMLAVLEEKTQGNASTEEAQMLKDAVHQLRMMYVQIESQLA